MEGDDADNIKEKADTLTQSSMKLGEAMYKASQEGGGDGPEFDDMAGDDKDNNDDVVDAEFEEVDENNKDKS